MLVTVVVFVRVHSNQINTVQLREEAFSTLVSNIFVNGVFYSYLMMNFQRSKVSTVPRSGQSSRHQASCGVFPPGLGLKEISGIGFIGFIWTLSREISRENCPALSSGGFEVPDHSSQWLI